MLRLRAQYWVGGMLIVTLISGAAWATNGSSNGTGTNDSSHCTTGGTLPTLVEYDVLHMREEEKLARDVYLALYDIWGLRVFDNISQSEQRHMDAIFDLIDCYGLEDPVVDDTPGVFTDPQFAALYITLVDAGTNSVMEALAVGALIEDMDIVDLRDALDQTSNPDVVTVFEGLLLGSENHLRAFVRQIVRAGGTYEPQFLTQEEFDEIIAIPSGNTGGQNPGGQNPGGPKRFQLSNTSGSGQSSQQ